ncbi:MAG: hypothetical protein Q7R41_09850, partial [Phycisphaerales bacterium]|nr:hypothetical protein [Phycisphaerales bacterium]
TSTTYHFRIVATNSEGTSNGSDQVFTTARFVGSPLVRMPLKINSRGRVTIGVRCPSGTIGGKCNVIANFFAMSGRLPANASAARRRTAKRIGRQKFSVLAGQQRTVKVRLSRATVAMLRSRSKTKMRLLLTARDGDKHVRTRGYRVTVKRLAR